MNRARAAWRWVTVPVTRTRAGMVVLGLLALGFIMSGIVSTLFLVAALVASIVDGWCRSPIPSTAPPPPAPSRVPNDDDRALARELVTRVLIATGDHEYRALLTELRRITPDVDAQALVMSLLGIQACVLAGCASLIVGAEEVDSDETAAASTMMWQKFAPLLSKAGW